MNKQQVTCDDAALEETLRSDESSEPSEEPSEELLAHVETCTRCQQRIAELAGPLAVWQGVKAAFSEADPKSFLKVADLDTFRSALLADEYKYYVFLPHYGNVYQVTSTANSLKVKRSIWPPGIKQKDPVAIATAELNETTGWQELNIAADPAINSAQLQNQEAHVLNI